MDKTGGHPAQIRYKRTEIWIRLPERQWILPISLQLFEEQVTANVSG